MIEIPLQALPNQSFSILLDTNLYDISINEAKGIMAATVYRNNVLIISGARIVAGTPFFAYEYEESGNFLILTNNGDEPYYDQFGITQSLIYASQAELEALRAT